MVLLYQTRTTWLSLTADKNKPITKVGCLKVLVVESLDVLHVL